MECDKIAYANREAVIQAIKTYRSRKKKKYDSYICPLCGEIHIYTTSKKKNKFFRKFRRDILKYPIKITDFITKKQ